MTFMYSKLTDELSTSDEGEPKWWNLKEIDKIPMQDEIRKKATPLFKKRKL